VKFVAMADMGIPLTEVQNRLDFLMVLLPDLGALSDAARRC
jgi:hypothetical protein